MSELHNRRTTWRWGVAAMMALWAVVAQADLFDKKLKAEEASAIGRLAIVSLFGDAIHGSNIGMMIFENKFFDGVVPEWKSDETLSEIMRVEVLRDPRFQKAEVLMPDAHLAAASFTGERESLRFEPTALLAYAGSLGYDAVLVVHRVGSSPAMFVEPSMTLIIRPDFGKRGRSLCALMLMELLEVKSGKLLAKAHGGSGPPCARLEGTVPWHDSWAEYSSEERHDLEEQMHARMSEQVLHELRSIKMGSSMAH